MDIFNGIATICVSHLGFSPACFSSDDKSHSYKTELALADRILEDIFLKRNSCQCQLMTSKLFGKSILIY